MTTYEENLKTLSSYYPEMDSLIEKARQNLSSDVELWEELNYEGEEILKLARNGRTCYLGGKRNNTEPARVWVETLGDLPENSPVFMMGVGNPSYLKELAEQTKRRQTIIIYEPCLPVFLHFLKKVPLKKWMEKHLLVFWVEGIEGMDKEAARDILFGILKYEMLSYTKTFVTPNYDVLFPQELVAFLQIARDLAREEILKYNTQMLFSNVMVKNLLSNARYLCDGYKITQLVEVLPNDIPAVLVAAGPSLNKNIKELKRAKGKAFLIAVDTAIKPLLREGIVPDMFLIIDALKPLDLVKIEGTRDIPLVTTLNAASEVLEYHTGRKFFYNEGYMFAEKIFYKSPAKFGTLDSGGSVATHGFSLLYKLGFQRIILVGQDLAYTNNRSHADGTFHEAMPEQDTRGCVMVEGNYEDEVPTASDMKAFLDWYDLYIEGCMKHRPGFHVINATEGGAKIKNTELMTLAEAVDRECGKEADIPGCIEKLTPMLDAEGQRWAREYLTGLPGEFLALARDASRARKLYQALDKICKKKNLDKAEYASILKKIEKQNKKISGQSAYQLVEMSLVQAQYIIRNEQFRQEDSVQEEGREIARKGILYMDNVEKCGKLFAEYAKEIYQDLTQGGEDEVL